MWTGLTKGFAGIQFSGSPNLHGEKNTNEKNIKIATKFSASFEVKNGENVTRRRGSLVTSGLVLPVSCKKIRCKPTITKTTNGSR